MPSTTLPLVDVADIVRLVGKSSFNRSRPYARNGAVQEVVWHADSGRLAGEVQGTADRPYVCWIELVPAKSGYHCPVDNRCTCPVNENCKHVAATLLLCNADHLRDENSQNQQLAKEPALGPAQQPTDAFTGQHTPALPPHSGRVTAPPQPEWKRAVSSLSEPRAASISPAGFGRQALDPKPGSPYRTSMGLQFELREQLPRTRERWRGPTARPATKATAAEPGSGSYRLGVRPVILNEKGNWVRANVSWTNITFLVNRLDLNPHQHRWFCEFIGVHRAIRGVVFGQEADWAYLDDFTSPLLWHLFGEASALGITLVGSKKDAVVIVGTEAGVTLDASAARPNADPDGPGPRAARDLRLTANLSIDGALYPAEQAGAIGTHGVYSYQLVPRPVITLAPTNKPLTDEQRRLLGRPSTMLVPAPDVAEFMAEYYPSLRQAISVTSTDASVQLPEAVPPALVLTAAFQPKHTLQLDWDWVYGEGPATTRLPLHEVGIGAGTHDDAYRDLATEHELLDRAVTVLQPLALAPHTTLQGIDAAEFTEKTLPRLEQVPGIRVDVDGRKPDYRELTEAPTLTITTVETDQRDWFDLGVIVTIEGKKVPFAPLFTALSKGQKKLLLVDNSYLSLRQPVFEQLHELIDEARALQEWDTGLRISRYQASLWAELEDLAEETEQAQAWRSAVSGLLELTRVEPVPLPTGVKASLRPYQLDGFTWLAFLWQHRLGGILADDMGLGKTLQTLALLQHAKETTIGGDGDRRPFLVVAPTSVVSNWVAEAERFTPGLTVRAVTATQAKSGRSLTDATTGADVVVTSYALLRLDFEAYQAQGWSGLILDEAQFVKNHAARVHICARDLDVPFKLAITGTPMENNLMELHALFAIVAPGLFPSARKFAEHYQRPIEGGGATGEDHGRQLLARLRRRIRPLMMRRTKELVVADLPVKQEQVLQIDLNPKHKKLYDTFLQRERQKLLGLIDDLDKNRFIVFRSLTLLRMLSLDASLVDEKYAAIPSSKLDALFEQLEDVVAEGHRALIFSQFTSFLKKAAARLDAQGTPYCYLDGSTLRRSLVIDRFKRGEAPVFLISLKAGGFGLNLTEADYVFLLDPWWNPATEAQAIDRTHRIGQNKNVMVYRMVATGTIEEKVMALKAQKAKLFNAVMDDDAVFSSALTAEDIRGLLEG